MENKNTPSPKITAYQMVLEKLPERLHATLEAIKKIQPCTYQDLTPKLRSRCLHPERVVVCIPPSASPYSMAPLLPRRTPR